MSFLLRGSLLVLLSTAAVGGYAQTTSLTLPAATATSDSVLLAPAAYSAGPYKAYLNKRYAQDAEARAVINLFSRKQTGGVLWLTTGTAVIGLIASQTGTKTTASGTTTHTVTPLGYGLLVGLFGGVGVGKLARFSNDKLYKALSEYDESRSLPAYVTQSIKPKDQR